MSNIFVAVDPRGHEVICTEENWNGHILYNRPWMAGWEDEVKAAIENPMFGFIYQDANDEKRNIYYALHKGKDRYLKVVVLFDELLGTVITAFPTSSPKSGEILIWPKSSL